MLVLMITWVATIPVEGIIGFLVHKEVEKVVAGVQLKPGSTKQVDEQPSPLKLFLSSHCYPGLGNPFPQNEQTLFKRVKVVSAQAVHTIELWQYKHPEAQGKHFPSLITEPV